jgi:hypothetical protein
MRTQDWPGNSPPRAQPGRDMMFAVDWLRRRGALSRTRPRSPHLSEEFTQIARAAQSHLRTHAQVQSNSFLSYGGFGLFSLLLALYPARRF